MDEESFSLEENETSPSTLNSDERAIKTPKKKFFGQRKEQFARLEREKQIHSQPENQRFCQKCTQPLAEVSQSFVRSEVIFIPARLKVVDFYQGVYECRCCKKSNLPAIQKAASPMPVIPHSYSSASAIAQIIVQKYVNAVPLYRQESAWQQAGLSLKRQTMSSWLLRVSEEYFIPLVNRLKEKLLEEQYLHADETRLEVLNEPSRKNTTNSFMWLYSTKEDACTPIRVFDYTETRNGDHAKRFLSGFCGYLLSDAYQGYEKVRNVTRCFCWSHLRRYFVESLPNRHSKNKDSLAGTAIQYCGQLFQLEKEFKHLMPENRQEQRQLKSLPILRQFWKWIDQNKELCLPKSKLFKAFQYALNQKE